MADAYDDYMDAVHEARYLRGQLGLPQSTDDTYRPADDVYEEVRDLRSRAIKQNQARGFHARTDAETNMLRDEFEQRYAGMTEREIAERAMAAIRKYERGFC